MPLIQDKTEAFWFYSVVSQGYDKLINPLFWTEEMRDRSLELGRLRPGLDVVDVGAGTGFTTTGIVQHADAERVTMVDQSPHQLAKAKRKPRLSAVTKKLGDAEAIPVATDSVDRYVSAGSVEYWPDPQRAVCEAYRVVKPGGVALLIGPLQRTNPLARWLSDTWMLFPPERDYERWFHDAGFTDIQRVHVAPSWWRRGWDAYGIAIAGTKPADGPSESPLAAQLPPLPEPEPRSALWRSPVRLARFAGGSLAGAAFIPVAAFWAALHKLRG